MKNLFSILASASFILSLNSFANVLQYNKPVPNGAVLMEYKGCKDIQKPQIKYDLRIINLKVEKYAENVNFYSILEIKEYKKAISPVSYIYYGNYQFEDVINNFTGKKSSLVVYADELDQTILEITKNNKKTKIQLDCND